MKTVKWLLVLLGLIFKVNNQNLTNSVINTCSNLGTYSPDNPGKCTVSSNNGLMCCFVSVTYDFNKTKNFCSAVEGSYLIGDAVADLQKDIGKDYQVSVICNASFVSFSLLVLSIITSLIIF
jgi:hypothetical protein